MPKRKRAGAEVRSEGCLFACLLLRPRVAELVRQFLGGSDDTRRMGLESSLIRRRKRAGAHESPPTYNGAGPDDKVHLRRRGARSDSSRPQQCEHAEK